MTTTISIGGIAGLFSLIASVSIMMLLFGMVNSALSGNLEDVNSYANNITESLVEEIKEVPFDPVTPYVYGGVAVILTSICAVFGIPIIFKK